MYTYISRYIAADIPVAMSAGILADISADKSIDISAGIAADVSADISDEWLNPTIGNNTIPK